MQNPFFSNGRSDHQAGTLIGIVSIVVGLSEGGLSAGVEFTLLGEALLLVTVIGLEALLEDLVLLWALLSQNLSSWGIL